MGKSTQPPQITTSLLMSSKLSIVLMSLLKLQKKNVNVTPNDKNTLY